MSDHETERLRFIRDSPPYHSLTVVDKGTGKTVAKIVHAPDKAVSDCEVRAWGGASFTIEHVRDILAVMTSWIPDGGLE